MGLSGVSIWELLIVLLIVVMIFGTKRLGSLGSDLGGAIRGFRKAMEGKDEAAPTPAPAAATPAPQLLADAAHPPEAPHQKTAGEAKVEEPSSDRA